MRAKLRRHQILLLSFELFDRGFEVVFARLRIEESAARIGKRNGLEHSSSSQGNHWLAAGQRLHWDNTEIFFARKNNCAAMCIEVAEFGIGHSPAELNGFSGHALQPRVFRAAT